MYAQLGKDGPQAAVTVRNFSCNLLLGTVAICFSSPNCQPEVLYYTCPCPAPLSLSLILVLQRWGCSVRVADAAVYSTQTKPKRFATRLFKMSTSRKQNAIQYI